MKGVSQVPDGDDFFSEIEDDVFGASVRRKSGFWLLLLGVFCIIGVIAFIAFGRTVISGIFPSSVGEISKVFSSKNLLPDDSKEVFKGSILDNPSANLSSSDNMSNIKIDSVDMSAVSQKSIPVWDTSSLYTSVHDLSVTSDLNLAKQLASTFVTKYSDADLASPGILDSSLKMYGEILDLTSKLSSYAYMILSVNKNDDVRKVASMIMKKTSDIESEIVFFNLSLSKLNPEGLNLAFAVNPDAAKYSYYIERAISEREHFLSEDVEKYATKKSLTSNTAWVMLFDKVSVSMRVDAGGSNSDLTISQALDLLKSGDAETRKSVSVGLGDVFRKNSVVVGSIYNAIVRDWLIDTNARKYSSAIDMRNFSNDVHSSVIDAMVSAVKSRYDLAHRYYKLKAKLLGMHKLPYYDRLAKLPFDSDQRYQWDDAKALVTSAYYDFSPKMSGIIGDFFVDNRIDARVSSQKDSGAYCISPSTSVKPFIMMSYFGSERDLFTLAHELGHGVHGVLSASQGSILLSQPPLTLAETASIFGERLLFEKLSSRVDTPLRKATLLSHKIEDLLATIVRQISFLDFEQRVFASSKDSDLSAEDISKIWMSVQEESLGDGVTFSENDRYYWVYISHFFHSPFYVYSYAFANLLVDSLYSVYQDGSVVGFQDKFIDFLSAGGSKNYKEIIAPFGVDLSDHKFWLRGMDGLEKLISEFEDLVESDAFIDALRANRSISPA